MEQKIKKGMEDILWCADFIAEHFEGDDKKTRLLKLEPGLLDLCLLDGRFSNFKNVAEATRSCEPGGETLSTIYERSLEEAESQPVDPTVHPMYLKYKKTVQEHTAAPGDDIDDEVAITASEVNTIDPFTLKQMVHPVRNKLCGHVYEMNSVKEMMHKKRSIKCPVVGCTVNSFKKTDIEIDTEMLKLLQRESRAHSSRS